MAYENFENTAFDLDRDGKINASEAAYIQETIFKDDSVERSEDDYIEGDGWYPTDDEYKKFEQELLELRESTKRQDRNVRIFTIGLLIVLCLIPYRIITLPIIGFVVYFSAEAGVWGKNR